MEMLELRLTMEHMRRKTQFAASRTLPLDSGDSMLAPISAHAPLSVGAVAHPDLASDAASDAAAIASDIPLTHAERFERARERAAAGGFSPTEPMERPMQRATPVTPTPTLPPIPFGFLPTQPHPEP